MKKFLFFLFLFFLGGAVVGFTLLDFMGLPPIQKGIVSSASAALGILSFAAVVAVLNDPHCRWTLLGPKGETLCQGAGRLLGNDNARGFGKAASTNAMSALGFVENEGGPLRFLQIAGDGESVIGSLNLLRLRKEYSVVLTLSKLPMTAAAAAEAKKARLEREAAAKAEAEVKAAAAFQAAIAQAFQGPEFKAALAAAMIQALKA